MRHPHPWFREPNKTWYVQIERKQVRLGKDKDAAFDKFHQLMARNESSSHDTVYDLLNR